MEEGDLRPEKAVQRMLELANQFGHKLDRRKKKARRAAQRKENDFLKKHTGTLTNLLQQAHNQGTPEPRQLLPKGTPAAALLVHHHQADQARARQW